MGHGASAALPPDAVATLRAVSTTALGHTRRSSRTWARSRLTATRADGMRSRTSACCRACTAPSEDVRRVQVGKQQYEMYNCGSELLNVPSFNKEMRVLELQDSQVTSFLLAKCKWTVWRPPAPWRMKADQVYDLTVHVVVRKHGFLTNEIRVIRMCVGKKWVGPHHHHNSDLAHEVKSQRLHRVEYETQDNIETAESTFFQTIKLAWDKYLYELSRLPKEDLRSSEESGNGFPFGDQDQHTSLRIRYLLETSLETIMSENGTFFRSTHQYELWRMAQEDDTKHRVCFEDNFAGPLLEAEMDALSELYEGKAMELEDVGVSGHSVSMGESLVVESIPSGPSDG